MKAVFSFLKTTLLGGILLVLPVWLSVVLVVKALMHLEIFVHPVSDHLPWQASHPRLLAVGILIALCFFVGLAVRTALGRQARTIVERHVLDRIPGYRMLRGVAAHFAQMKEQGTLRPALIEIEDALVPGFLVEEHAAEVLPKLASGPKGSDGPLCTVFVPSAPTPAAGAIYIIAANRVHPIDVPLISMVRCITHWGEESRELVAAWRHRSNAPPSTPEARAAPANAAE